ncbi:MAG: YitT family protein [Clostridia bacterium]|nr:YitT family protein [Clostridia bacterium]
MEHTAQRRFSLKDFAAQLFWECIGSLLIAVGICCFALPGAFPMTGFSGIAIILYRLTGLPVGLATVLLNLPVAVCCFRLLGKKFMVASLRCMLLSSLFTDVIGPMLPVYGGNRLLAALCTGVITGLGYALIYMRNSSTGGSDFLIMSVKALRPHLSVGSIAFLSDVLIILAGGFLFRDADGVILGFVIAWLLSVVVDKVLLGANAGKLLLIVTDHGKRIADAIEATCQRGSTILNGRGGYREDPRQVVLCACSNKDMVRIRRAVAKTDPRAFTVILGSHEVHGEGFRMVEIGESEG